MKKGLVVFCIVMIGAINCSFSQANTTNVYYDSIWQTTSAENAFYRRKFIDLTNYYSCFTFWAKTNKLYSRSNCLNISPFPKRIGTFKSYYENGQLKDSMKYSNDGILLRSYKYFETGEFSDSVSYDDDEQIVQADHYYTNGRPYVHFFWNGQTNEAITEAYDEKGEKIENFIYNKPGSYPWGGDVWMGYLQNNINFNVPFINKAPKGTYRVVVYFTINEDGSISNVASETNYGYGMEEEVIRVVKASAKWKPPVQLNQIVKGFRRQPVTFRVDDK